MKPFGGYTLIELLISLAIMAGLLSIGTLSYRDYSRRQLVIGAERAVIADLRLAQQEALAGKKPPGCSGVLNQYQFLLDSSLPPGTGYQIRALCSGSATPIVVRSVVMPSNTAINTFSPNVIVFKPLGQGTNLSSSVTLIIRATIGSVGTADVVISPSGDIQ